MRLKNGYLETLRNPFYLILIFLLNIFAFIISAHINHIKDVAGIDHVGIGAGYDGVNL